MQAMAEDAADELIQAQRDTIAHHVSTIKTQQDLIALLEVEKADITEQVHATQHALRFKQQELDRVHQEADRAKEDLRTIKRELALLLAPGGPLVGRD